MGIDTPAGVGVLYDRRMFALHGNDLRYLRSTGPRLHLPPVVLARVLVRGRWTSGNAAPMTVSYLIGIAMGIVLYRAWQAFVRPILDKRRTDRINKRLGLPSNTLWP